MIVEGIVHPEFAENVPSAHPKYTVDEFVSSSEQIGEFSIMLYWWAWFHHPLLFWTEGKLFDG